MTQLTEIFGPGGRLAGNLANFEPRDGQHAMAEAVADVLLLDAPERQDHDGPQARVLLIEAETGIGKTLAYLIPAALSGKRVVISTATLNLQDQIINKDLPLVEKVLDEKIAALCIKGRENYLCQYRWYQYRSNPQLSLVDDPWVEQIDTWLKKTATGDRAELGWLSKKAGLWSKIASQSNHCLGADCPEAAGCFISQLRKRAGKARLLIVNHHLFFSDLALRKSGFGEILPRYEAVIFDEAHHLENVASTFFGKSFSHYQLIDLLGDIERQAKLDLPPEMIDTLLPSVHGLKMRLDGFGRFFPVQTGRFFLQTLIKDQTETVWREQVELLSAGITGLADRLVDCTAFGDGWSGLIKRAGEQNDKLRDIALFFDNNDHKYVHWYEKRDRTVLLSATPIEVADELQKNLYATVDACILTSATLSSGGSFSYIKERLGLKEDVRDLQFSSPFDYRHRTLLYVPETSFPEPTHQDFLPCIGDRVLQILRLSEGRALVLCTSFKGMDSLAAFLEGALDYPVLVQGRASRNALLNSFREETHSVLLAVASFWEGVDVVGESLSCVIIEKLPFEVPSDPVIQARIDRIKEEGGKPFFDFQVPRAILTLRQGVGRLMRSVTDRGVIAIMDVRLFKKGYGRVFLKSLPASPVTRNMVDIANFYAENAHAERTEGDE
ncbi:ATP-dependent DNA helicase [Desulfopila sp. IMCC35006]|uniref:ATP-dependent DNA helicase n=1 Tax=Desulfopila sp. IMCC35006 TaxID=2569542 RepID=UPI001F11772A|nr:ATP-dependent DNA helicase [Desulfopila sp. IMCC35006]